MLGGGGISMPEGEGRGGGRGGKFWRGAAPPSANHGFPDSHALIFPAING